MKSTGLFILMVIFSAYLQAGDDIDFNRDIRPIISENCVHCHGPDEESREGGLRLDIAEGASEDLGGYQAVVPHDLENSELWLRIDLPDDDSDLMPPKKSKRKLSDEQKQLLKLWIESGGKYDQHWAFVQPKKATVPAAQSPVDFFIEKRLSEMNLQPSKKADPRKLIRRASLDVIGIPPTPEEVEHFLDAYRESPEQAYRSLVDRLLDSPRFGERWARQWLDLARYADSNGFQADQLRDSWAFRDWVIKAFNNNMPYDQFSIEQLAGDLLPNATIDQKIATGFHRTVTCNVEAGVHAEENRTNQVVDRVNTTATVWLGVTLECAQCHDHKYDPFSMTDYYQLFAYFNNTPLEVSLPKSKTDVSHDFIGPFMDLPEGKDIADQRKKIQDQLKVVNAKLKKQNSAGKLDLWVADLQAQSEKPAQWQVAKVDGFESKGGETSRVLEDQSVLVTGKFSKLTTYRISAKTELKQFRAVKLEALTHNEIPGKGPGRGDAERTNFVLTDFQVLVDGKKIDLVNPKASFSQSGWSVASLLAEGKGKKGWAIAPQFGKDHWATFETSEPISLSKDSKIELVLDHQYAGGRTIGRARVSLMDGVPSGSLSKEILTIAGKGRKERSKAEAKKLQQAFLSNSPKLAALQKQVTKLDRELKKLKVDQTLVMEELEQTRMTHIMNRGNYLEKGEKVQPDTPAILPAIAEDLPKNRLGLAKWLVNGENPLVARVVVNRWWAELFGRGIVATVEDFGTQSEPPTHPQLLDWLATELVESGWDRKHLLKQILLSDTYQQSSAISSQHASVDPANHYLARAPRFRLEAERVRDNALAVSGLLSTKMYGRPIMPYQPPNIWRQVGRNEPKWVEAKDEDRWRRGIYIVYRRAAPYPSMVNFDAPDRGSCSVARPRTNTPLQALTLLNDPAYVEMALALADRILTESPSSRIEDRLNTAFQTAFSRQAKPAEVKHLAQVVTERYDHFKSNHQSAIELLKSASSVYRPRHSDKTELATWFYIGNILLNLDEMVTKS